MTNRRRSGKGRAAVSKKSESPDKQTRKINRRNRRSKKSESPERPEDAGSDYSGEELEDGHNKGVDGDESDNYKEGNQFDSSKINEDQRSQLKEEESGGSDGSWKVKSENGGGGGIPKLKLCLTRPPEMSSPTSTSEQNPSPRRRRRSGRGNATPTKEEEQMEESPVEECTKRVTRNQKAKEIYEQEVPVVGKNTEEQSEEKEPEANEIYNSSNNEPAYNEEDETRLAVESISAIEQTEDSQTSMGECIQEEMPQKEENEDRGESNEERFSEKSERIEQHFETPVESIPIPSVEKPEGRTEETEKMEVSESEPSKEEPSQEEESNSQGPEVSVPLQEEDKSATEPGTKPQPEPEPQQEAQSEPQPEPEQEQESEAVIEKRRSSSRDSSEERAKEAALRSRNKNKKKEGSDDGEVNETPAGEVRHQEETQEKSKTSSVAITASESERKENHEEPAPVKSGARKRRWGSSTSKNAKKPSVSISTDFLKEIIPEVKPLLLSEVQLSPNEEDEEGQLKDSEENLPVVTKKVEREKMMQSDESEKDYEEEAVESGVEEPGHMETAKPTVQVKEKEFTTFTRKVSVMSSNERLPKSPSPPRHKPSNILYIVNLVRPFTIPQLKELLARTGTITEDGFWIDKIKSKCYVKYETEEEAKTTRHALHGVRWPVSNPKQLDVDFGTEAAMKAAMEGNDVAPKRPIPSLFDKHIDLKTGEKTRERERERERDRSGERRERNEKDKKDRSKHREEDKREGDEDKDKKSRPPVEPLVRDRTVRRVTMPVREWDVGKNEDGFSPPPDGMEFSRHRDERYERRVEYDRDKTDDYDDRRRRDKARGRRSVSGEPPRKSKKKTEEEAPAKLLDDLFRKTKATPIIYWLPLTPEQIAVKEEMRRKHMAEHEKKVAELRKMQREQSKRNSDKRRRRTKSRSRSRSPKK